MAEAIPNVAATKTGATVFGRMCRKMVRPSVAPSAFAATTYSRDFVFRNSPRVSRAIVGQLVIPINGMQGGMQGGFGGGQMGGADAPEQRFEELLS